MTYRILLAEDEKKMQVIIRDYFYAKGCELVCAKDGVEALALLNSQKIDLILLDVMMPKLDGFSVCKEIRSAWEMPIIFLTAKSDEEDKLYGYELGADDYVTKPFSLAVLYAKSMALIKRMGGEALSEQLKVGEITVYQKNKRVDVGDKTIDLANLEYKILLYLIRNKGRIVSREQLLNQIWGYEFEGNDRVVDSHVKKLRKALGPCASYIKTVIKMGYEFEVKGNGR